MSMLVDTVPQVPTAAPRTAKPRRRRLNRRRTIVGVIMTLPALALVLVAFVIPLGLLAVMSFFNWPLLGRVRPNGLDNYARVFTDQAFGQAIVFTLQFTAVLVPLSIVVSYLAAVMVRSGSRYSGFLRTSFFLPVTIGFTAAAYMFSVLLLPNTGLVNVALRSVGVTDGSTTWFTQVNTAFWAAVIITLWKSIGVAMILLMASMQAIPLEIYESAKIDGAGWFRREWSLTIPLIRRQIALALILALSGTFLTFDQFYVLTDGGPSGQTLTAVFYNYIQSFVRYNLGYGAAISMVITAIILVIVVIQLRVLRASRSEA